MASVSIQGLRKSFGTTPVLRGVSLDIRDGEFLTLVGPSGCGKTTLLRILAGLDHADEGVLFIGDTPVDHLPPKRRDVAMVFQSYALYPYMSVRQNMALPLLMRRLSRLQRMPLMGRWLPGTRATLSDIDSTVAETAESLGLGSLLAGRVARFPTASSPKTSSVFPGLSLSLYARTGGGCEVTSSGTSPIPCRRA